MNIRLYTIDGWHCLGYQRGGVVYIMSWLAPKGERFDTTGRYSRGRT